MKGDAAHALVAGDRVVVPRLLVARGFFGRGLGLMGRAALPPGFALHLAPCRDLHTLFMRFAIDVIFLDAEGRVTMVRRGVPPWRIVRGGRDARAAVEMTAGWLPAEAVREGDRLAMARAEEEAGAADRPAAAPAKGSRPPGSS